MTDDESESCKRAREALSEICGTDTLDMLVTETLPGELADLRDSYRADFEVRGTYSSIADQWDRSYDKNAAVTGLYFPEDELMMVDNRSAVHHNDQLNRILDTIGPLSPVLPWASATRNDTFHIELARSHGGLYQAIARSDHDDITRINRGIDVKPRHVIDVAYAARLTDHPPSSEYDVSFAGDAIRDLPEEMKFEVSVDRQILTLGDVYDLLRTTPAGLPDPLFNRSEL
jgi:hypothetical protein